MLGRPRSKGIFAIGKKGGQRPAHAIHNKFLNSYIFCICFIIAVLTSLSPGLFAGEKFKKSFRLTDDKILHVYEGSIGGRPTVTISILSSFSPGHEMIDEAYTIGNVGTHRDDIKRVKFCNRCATAYFITVSDVTANHALHWGVVVWRDKNNFRSKYSFSVLPLISPYVKDANGDGVHVIVGQWPGQEKRAAYKFQGGRLVRVRY